MKRKIQKLGVEPWPKIFQNLRVTRENELLLSGEYRPEAIHAWIGHTEETYKSNYFEITDDDYVAKSERSGVAEKIFPQYCPKDHRTDPSNKTVKSNHSYEKRGSLGSASKCKPNKPLLAPPVGLEPTTPCWQHIGIVLVS